MRSVSASAAGDGVVEKRGLSDYDILLAEIAVVGIAEVGEAAVGENHPGEGIFVSLHAVGQRRELGEQAQRGYAGD